MNNYPLLDIGRSIGPNVFSKRNRVGYFPVTGLIMGPDQFTHVTINCHFRVRHQVTFTISETFNNRGCLTYNFTNLDGSGSVKPNERKLQPCICQHIQKIQLLWIVDSGYSIAPN